MQKVVAQVGFTVTDSGSDDGAFQASPLTTEPLNCQLMSMHHYYILPVRWDMQRTHGFHPR